MNNIGKYILETQNNSFQIDMLLAQRNIYSRAKICQLILIIFSVSIPVILFFIVNLIPRFLEEKSWIYILYSIVAILIQKILESYIENLKKLAASIQEEFDLTVFNIPKSKTLKITIIEPEVIFANSIKQKRKEKGVESVRNWYSLNIANLKTNIAIILCQRTNIYYDFSLRKRYIQLIKILALITFIISLAFFLYDNTGLKSLIMMVVLPSTPIILYVYDELKTNDKSIENLEQLKKLIESQMKNLSINRTIDVNLLRNIQDHIYINRVESPLIPDIFYNFKRDNTEDEMNYSVNERIEKIFS